MVGTEKYTKVIAKDSIGQGNAKHFYQVVDSKTESNVLASAMFQNGPVLENGVNGCHQEDLIAIVIDRLESFQSGEYACSENEMALNKLHEALFWLRHRTQKRVDRGIEGKSIV